MLVPLLLTLAAGRVVDTEASEAPRDLLAFLPLLAPQAAHGFQVSAARQAAPRLATGLAPWTSARAPQLLAAESWEGARGSPGLQTVRTEGRTPRTSWRFIVGNDKSVEETTPNSVQHDNWKGRRKVSYRCSV